MDAVLTAEERGANANEWVIERVMRQCTVNRHKTQTLLRQRIQTARMAQKA